MSDNSYQQTFYTVPFRIMYLPGITIAYARIYELIFQFWHHGKECFISNKLIKERTGVGSESTVREALAFFEKHNEIRREIGLNGKRYIVQPKLEITDKTKNKTEKLSTSPAAKSTTPRRQVDAPPAAKSTHNNNNINNTKLIKDKSEKNIFCSERKREKKKEEPYRANPRYGVKSDEKMKREKEHVIEHEKIKRAPMPESLRSLIKQMMPRNNNIKLE